MRDREGTLLPDQWHDPEFVERWDARVRAGSAHRTEQVDIVITAMDSSVPRGGHVLDLGVGTGLVALEILRRRPDVELSGIDSSEAALGIARERLGRFSGRLRLTRGDMVDDMPQGAFDAVIAVQTLHHITDEAKDRALGQIRDRLTPSGILVVAERLALDTAHFADEVSALRDRRERLAGEGSHHSHPDFAEKAAHQEEWPLSLDGMLAWLREGGFHALCLDLHLDLVVIAGRPGR